jgi:CBS domain-containing protein
MITVKDLLKVKGSEVYAVSPETQTLDALKLLADKNVGALLVVEGKKLAGIVSERDIVRQITKQGQFYLDQPVKQIMTKQLYVIAPTQNIAECMTLMSEHHIRHLPVVENDQIVGVISIGDVVNHLIADHEFTIANLEKYITGSGYNQ